MESRNIAREYNTCQPSDQELLWIEIYYSNIALT